jgi:hypothetical protein
LRFLSPAIQPKLAVLALRAKVGKKTDAEAVLAQKFLDAVDAMNTRLGIPATLVALREEDIPALAAAACREADANYPVPLYMTQAICEQVIRQVLPDAVPVRVDKAVRTVRTVRTARVVKAAVARKTVKKPQFATN